LARVLPPQLLFPDEFKCTKMPLSLILRYKLIYFPANTVLGQIKRSQNRVLGKKAGRERKLMGFVERAGMAIKIIS
jgi:hypothetical protein